MNLCLDTGHLAYRRAATSGSSEQYPERIGYVHIKQMDRPSWPGRAGGHGVWAGGRHGGELRAAGGPARRSGPWSGSSSRKLEAEHLRRRRAGHVPRATSTFPCRLPRAPGNTCTVPEPAPVIVGHSVPTEGNLMTMRRARRCTTPRCRGGGGPRGHRLQRRRTREDRHTGTGGGGTRRAASRPSVPSP